MSVDALTCEPASTPPRRWLAMGVLVLAIMAAYGNSLSGAFVSDDGPAIIGNPTIRHLWPLSRVLLPQAEGGLTVSGRPVLNLSLALNYAISGEAVWSYHALNILIHTGAALLLFGIVRRTLVARGTIFLSRDDRVEDDATWLALTIAALWALHPLQTQAVSYTVQRAESLMGFFYLLTLYAFVRGTSCHLLNDNGLEKPGGSLEVCHLLNDKRIGRSRRWLVFSFSACGLGMGTKEVMATAPLMVLLYDRTFVSGSLRAAWRERRGFYLGLAATWLGLGALVLSTGGNRGGTVGVGVGVPWWAYGLTQFQAVARYLALGFWPQPLVFEYGQFWVQRAGDILPYVCVVLPLVLGTVVALGRWPALGFLGAWFFGILTPSSLAPGTIQMIVEHRPYLPLAALMVAVVVTFYRRLGDRALIGFAAVAIGFGGLTGRRNRDYVSAVALWADTVAKRPDNSRARDAFADVLMQAGRNDEAIAQDREAVRLRPEEATFHFKLGIALAQSGRFSEAVACFAIAERVQPAMTASYYHRGLALVRLGRLPEAIAAFEEVLRRVPGQGDAQFMLGNALVATGRPDVAVPHYETAIKINPSDAEAHHNLGAAYAQLDRFVEARREFEAALHLKPDYPDARRHLEQVRTLLGP